MTCTHRGCENEAEFQCVMCQQAFCARHTHEQSAYPFQTHHLCKADFDEEVFLLSQPHSLELGKWWGRDEATLLYRVNWWVSSQG
jgi:hypothetical protein